MITLFELENSSEHFLLKNSGEDDIPKGSRVHLYLSEGVLDVVRVFGNADKTQRWLLIKRSNVNYTEVYFWNCKM